MTIDPIDRDRLASEARLGHLLTHLLAALAVVRAEERGPVAEILVAWLDEVGAGSPRLDTFGDVREDARFWADLAHPAELEAYVGAGLRRIERTQFAAGARKRLLVTLWEAMSPQDKARFLTRADPDGTFRRASA